MVNDKSLRIKFGESSVDSRTLLVLFVILELMFLPYIRALHCSAGMVLVVLWCVPNILGRIKEFTWFFIACVAISNLNGYLFHYVGTYGITQAILVIYSFILLDFFSEAGLEDRSRMIKCVLFLYVLFNFLLAMIYAASPEEYFSLRSTWTMSNTQIEFTGMRINRFTSIFFRPKQCRFCTYGYSRLYSRL